MVRLAQDEPRSTRSFVCRCSYRSMDVGDVDMRCPEVGEVSRDSDITQARGTVSDSTFSFEPPRVF